jgi:hypothetical protein
MDLPRLSRSVRRVTVLSRDDSGKIVPVIVYDGRRRKKKKGSRMLKPVERMVRQMARANDAAAADYLRRHKKTNRKRRDGWLRDAHVNLLRAGQKGAKKIEPGKLLTL